MSDIRPFKLARVDSKGPKLVIVSLDTGGAVHFLRWKS
jgi:hypothetical protein